MRQPNGCLTPALKSSAAKQWKKELTQMKKEGENYIKLQQLFFSVVFLCLFIAVTKYFSTLATSLHIR